MKKIIVTMLVAVIAVACLCFAACSDEHTHVFDQEPTLVKEATCSSKALYVKSCVCGEKGETYEDGEKLPHTPADAVNENLVEATCAKEGSYDEVVYCSVCNGEISRTAEKVDMLEHTLDEENMCTVCHFGAEVLMNDKNYATFDAALEAAQSGDTLYIVKDIEFTTLKRIDKNLSIIGMGDGVVVKTFNNGNVINLAGEITEFSLQKIKFVQSGDTYQGDPENNKAPDKGKSATGTAYNFLNNVKASNDTSLLNILVSNCELIGYRTTINAPRINKVIIQNTKFDSINTDMSITGIVDSVCLINNVYTDGKLENIGCCEQEKEKWTLEGTEEAKIKFYKKAEAPTVDTLVPNEYVMKGYDGSVSGGTKTNYTWAQNRIAEQNTAE